MSMLMTHFSNLCTKATIVKKLLGFQVKELSKPGPSPGSPLEQQQAQQSIDNSMETPWSPMYEKDIRALVKKLKKTPDGLDELERSITTRDPFTKCIIVPINKSSNRARKQVVSRKNLPHVVYCRIWRFADLQSSNELRSVPHCKYGYHEQSDAASKMSSFEEQMVCINPYHYDRNETVGNNNVYSHPPLTVYVPAKLKLQQQAAANNNSENNMMDIDIIMSPQDDLMQNFHGSVNSPTTTSPASILSHQLSPFISEDDASEISSLISPSPPLFSQKQQIAMDMLAVPMVPQPHWCSISYYEMKQRIGEMFHTTVNSVTIDGYTEPLSASRFCLGVFSTADRSEEIDITRRHIGKGLMLSYENGQVFAECLSENSVFVQSANCNQRYNWHLTTVVKIPPKCRFKIFDEADFVNMANMKVYQGFEAVYQLTPFCIIRISFVKGWGAEYRRQTVLDTPCWIEVHLNNPLKLLDQILIKMGSPKTIATSFS